MLTLGRHIKSNYLSPMASSISKARLKYGGSHGVYRSQGDGVPASNPSVYQNAELGQAHHSTTNLQPSERELDSLQMAPNFAYVRRDSPHMMPMQPQAHFAQAYYAQPHYAQTDYAAQVGTDHSTAGAPLIIAERSIRSDSNYSVNHRLY